MPANVPAGTLLLVQRVRALEQRGFDLEAEATSTVATLAEAEVGDLELVADGERLRVLRRADTRAAAGYPPRSYRRQLADLAVGPNPDQRPAHRRGSLAL